MRQLIIIKQGDADTLTEIITGLPSLDGYSAKLYIVDSAGVELDTITGTINGLEIIYEIVNDDSKNYPIGEYEFETKIWDNCDHVYTPTSGKFIIEKPLENNPT